jgi:hypothetical protein
MSDNNQEAVKPVRAWAIYGNGIFMEANVSKPVAEEELKYYTADRMKLVEVMITPIESKEPVSPVKTGVSNPFNVTFVSNSEAERVGDKIIKEHGELLKRLAEDEKAEKKNVTFNEALKILSNVPTTDELDYWHNKCTELEATIKADAVEIERLKEDNKKLEAKLEPYSVEYRLLKEQIDIHRRREGATYLEGLHQIQTLESQLEKAGVALNYYFTSAISGNPSEFKSIQAAHEFYRLALEATEQPFKGVCLNNDFLKAHGLTEKEISAEEALEWIFKKVCDGPYTVSQRGSKWVIEIMPPYGANELVGRGETPLEAIRAAMKKEQS